MVRFLTNDLMRITSGLGLLLLLAVQEKVCPWLSAPEEATPQVAQIEGPPTEDEESPKPEPVTLAGALPDAMLGRWSWCSDAALAQISSAEYGGTVACGSRGPARPAVALPPAAEPAYRSLLGPLVPVGYATSTAARQLTPKNVAFGTSISTNGPPRC
ncbi:MAG: hypothetical protein KKB50_03580 [Planctomycetes bacterium]|nr:hypothetical protein [Planctomycetota bacterium]